MPQTIELLIRDIENLTSAAKHALAVGEQEVEDFLAAVTPYLDRFDILNASFKPDVLAKASNEQKNNIQDLLLNLDTLHKQVIARAESNKGMVSEVISDIHKRSSAMKRYVDTFPQRVSMTKKKEG